MKLIKFINNHKIISIIIAIAIFIFPIIIVHALFKLTTHHKWLIAEWGAGDLLSYCGAVLGATATIVAIVLTITFTVENQKHERKLSIRPCLHTTYIPKYIRMDTIVKERQIVYITYPLDEKEHIGSSHEPPYILEKAEEDKVKGVLESLSFYRENYIIHYTISNVGAGNAINIKFTIDGKQIMKPFTLVANNSKEFIIILRSKLLNNRNRSIWFNFEYEDVASIGKYKQQEYIEFYLEDDGSLNTRQSLSNILSMPTDL
ncbi:hypothetical protein [Wukongibacter baidiensis]